MAENTLARNNALGPVPIYGKAYSITYPLLDADGDTVTGATTPDAEKSLNGDTFTDCTNESTEIASGSGVYYLNLTAAEMTADVVAIQAKSATAGMKTTVAVLYPVKLPIVRSGTGASAGSSTSTIVLDSGASAIDDYYNGCVVSSSNDGTEETRTITDYVGSTKTATVVPDWNLAPDNNDTFEVRATPVWTARQADLIAIGGAAVSTSTAQLGVNAVNLGGTAQTGRDIGASVLLSSGTGTGQVKLSAGYVAPNWGDVGNPTTTVGLSGTTVKTATDVETKVDTLLTRITSTLFSGITQLSHWLGAIAGKQTPNSTAQTEIRATGAGSGTYDATTDSNEALRDNTGTAGAGLTAIDLPDQTMNITGNITGNLSGSVGSVTGAVGSVTAGVTLADDAITASKFDESTAFPLKSADTGSTTVARTGADGDTLETLSDQIDDLPTNAELTTALGTADDAVLAQVALVKAVTDKIDDTLEDDAGTYRFTANALEEAPTGGSAPSAADIADAVWEEDISDHSGTVGSTAEALNAAGSAGDPWTTALPGSYTGSQAGKILADVLVDTAEIGAAGAGLTNINLPNQTMDIVGSITGNLAGSVGSVTGAVGSVTGNVGGNVTGSVASVTAGVTLANDAITSAKIAAGAIGSSEIADGALTAAKFASGAFDAVWTVTTRTLTSFGTVVSDVATAVWGAATRLLTAGTNIVLAKGTGVTGFNDLSAAQVNAEVDTALVDYDAPTKAELDSAVAPLATAAAVSGVQSDTNDIQTRLPAALVDGRMVSNVKAVNDVELEGTGVLGDEWGPV
jgi:hypothetical protein